VDDDDDYVHPKKKGKGKAKGKVVEAESEDELTDEEMVVKTSSGNHKGSVRRSKRLKAHGSGPAQPGV